MMTIEELFEAVKPLEERMFAWLPPTSSAIDFAATFSDNEIDLLIDALEHMEYSVDPDYYPRICNAEEKLGVIVDYVTRSFCEELVSGNYTMRSAQKWFELFQAFHAPTETFGF